MSSVMWLMVSSVFIKVRIYLFKKVSMVILEIHCYMHTNAVWIEN